MRLLLVSLNYKPEITGVGPYSGGLAQCLSERGHIVEVVCAKPFYPEWKLFSGHSNWTWSSEVEGGVTVRRCPIYIPGKINGNTRLLHYGSFAAASLVPIMRAAQRLKPNIIMNVAPTLASAPAVLLASRVFKTKSWLHIQDFEVEAGFATGQMKSAGSLARIALGFESIVLRNFDRVSSISTEMCRKINEKRVHKSKIFELRNWAFSDNVSVQENSHFRKSWGLGTNDVALYSGSLAKKQGIEMLIDVARKIQSRRDISVIICGDGPNRIELEELSRDLPNLQIRPLQPLDRLSELLALASVHLLPQKAAAADLVLPSKLCNMLASGRPIVAGARSDTGLAREILGCGICVPPENSSAMAEAIVKLVDNPELRKSYGLAAQTRANEYWSRDKIITNFVDEAERLVASGGIHR